MPSVNSLVPRGDVVKRLGQAKIVFMERDYEANKLTLRRANADIYDDLTAEIEIKKGDRFARVVGSYLDDTEFSYWRGAIEEFGQLVRENPDKRIEDLFEEHFNGMLEA